jgi:hypothetical protein
MRDSNANSYLEYLAEFKYDLLQALDKNPDNTTLIKAFHEVCYLLEREKKNESN